MKKYTILLVLLALLPLLLMGAETLPVMPGCQDFGDLPRPGTNFLKLDYDRDNIYDCYYLVKTETSIGTPYIWVIYRDTCYPFACLGWQLARYEDGSMSLVDKFSPWLYPFPDKLTKGGE